MVRTNLCVKVWRGKRNLCWFYYHTRNCKTYSHCVRSAQWERRRPWVCGRHGEETRSIEAKGWAPIWRFRAASLKIASATLHDNHRNLHRIQFYLAKGREQLWRKLGTGEIVRATEEAKRRSGRAENLSLEEKRRQKNINLVSVHVHRIARRWMHLLF